MLECFKTDWIGNISTPRLNAYKLCGPGVNRIEDVDPMAGVLLRWDVGTM